ncbi:phosphopantothenoylcysteine decarboxylase-like protein [Tanacetum coccineum]
MIPLGQKNTLAEYMILSDANNRPPMLDKDLYDSWKSFAVHVFSPGDDPIACLNKAIAFLTVRRQGQSYSGTRYKSNATSSWGNNASGQARVAKCYNCQCEGHMARKCTQPKRPRNAAWYKDTAMLAEARQSWTNIR